MLHCLTTRGVQKRRIQVSATNRGAVRHASDFYATPEDTFKPLLPFLSRNFTHWEPASGDGRLIRWMSEYGLRVDGDDLNNGYDFLLDDSIRECIITNPPFGLAFEFCQHAVRHAQETFMLLRLNFLASEKRKAWFKANPATVFVICNRPCFAIFAECHTVVHKESHACGVTTHRQGCGHRWSVSPEAGRPKVCPNCGVAKPKITSNDSADYAWFYWGERYTKNKHL